MPGASGRPGRVLLGDLDLSAHPVEIAPHLLGARLVSEVGGAKVVVRIVEVEAYGGVGEDPGSHAYRRRTPRNATMFGPPGHAYVYFTYGMHWCVNLVTGLEGTAGAVLIRAARVVEGAAIAWQRRPTARRPEDLCRGPARLTAALGITGVHDGARLIAHPRTAGDSTASAHLVLLPREEAVRSVAQGPRTGVRGPGADVPWRFSITDDPAVSPYRPAQDRPARDRLAGDSTLRSPHRRASGQIGP